jgi:hypothetical protein
VAELGKIVGAAAPCVRHSATVRPRTEVPLREPANLQQEWAANDSSQHFQDSILFQRLTPNGRLGHPPHLLGEDRGEQPCPSERGG